MGGLLGDAAKWLGVSPGSLLNAGGNLLSGYLGSNAADKAADQQAAAAREANALARDMYNQQRADLAPWREAGSGALGQIQALLADPSSLTSTPGYEFGLSQGVKALERSAPFRSGLYSGRAGQDLTRFGNDYGSTKLNESYNRLANLAGLGQVGATGSAMAAGQYGQTAGQNITGAGNAQASGTVGSANAWGNALGSILNNWQMDDILRQLGRGP